MQVLREIERDTEKRNNHSYTFETVLEDINSLLPAIELKRTDRGFEVYGTHGERAKIDNKDISSGESELVALAIEILVFSRTSVPGKILLLDEPDVHLHPDLQYRLGQFLIKYAKEGGTEGEDKDFKVVIATHSTALTSAFVEELEAQVLPITSMSQDSYKPFTLDDKSKTLLPIFGIHPLSQQFLRSPILLVEGDDDKRVFDQVVRSSNGALSFWPCSVGSVSSLAEWESWLDDYLPSIYDEPFALSLRDGDGTDESIDDLEIVKRARLNCYSIENLLLCEQSLFNSGHSQETFISAIAKWIELHPDHSRQSTMQTLLSDFDARKDMPLKDIRNILIALLDSTKPWEVYVGQLIAGHHGDLTESSPSVNSLQNYLGADVIEKLLR
jgi:hypothetical protein